MATGSTGDILTESMLVQHADTVVALDTNGEGTIAFPLAYSTPPTIVCVPEVSTANQRVAQVIARTGTTFTVRVYSAGTAEPSVSRRIHWMAAGPRA